MGITNDKELTEYMGGAIRGMVKGVLKGTFKNPGLSAYLVRLGAALERADSRRQANETEGLHVPSFLICSIADQCNLHCAGCYAHAEGICGDVAKGDALAAGQWLDIFTQAQALGVSFCLLAGGEPLLRPDVLEAAARLPDMAFPIFTNGTLIDEDFVRQLRKRRNLLPVLSLEGNADHTDARRGKGQYANLLSAMEALSAAKVLYGASITVTTENLLEVTSEDFVGLLAAKGCRLVFLVEYVPVGAHQRDLAPGLAERQCIEERCNLLRHRHPDMAFLNFPGDEQYLGGCLAAGRGFFHIGTDGAAQPCPFSPYSDCNVAEVGLAGALRSPLFAKLQQEGLVGGEHDGGCVLFEHEDKVRDFAQGACGEEA